MRDDTLARLQAASGLCFAGFLGLHLLNTWAAAFGPGAYDSLQGVLRWVYQWWPLEVIVLAAAAVHGVSGVVRMRRARAGLRRPALGWRARVHRYSGLFLLLVIVGHVLAVRGPSWFLDISPGFAGLAFTLDYLPAYFYPYYFVLGLAGLYHGLNGSLLAVARLGINARVRLSERGLAVACAAGAVATFAALLGLGGWLYDIVDPYQSEFAALVLELIGSGEPDVASSR